MKGNKTLGSLFDGIAGFPLAAKRHCIDTLWVSEIEPNCIDIVARHFPEAEQLGDITKIDGSKVKPVDIISFGSPCQNLSIAGDQSGIDGEKSSLFFEAIRIVHEMRGATNGKYPEYIIWENVEGAFSSNKGEDFKRVLKEITKANIPMPDSGRWATAGMVRNRGESTAWRKMDAQYWGVPQRRNRIYLIHDFRGERAGKILFECESMFGNYTQGRTKKENTTHNYERGTYTADRRKYEGYRIARFGEYKEGVGTLRASGGDNGGGSETLVVEKTIKFIEAYQHHGYRVSSIANAQTAGANSSVRGDTSFVVENDVIKFDDFTKNDNGEYWACICDRCVNKYGIQNTLLDDAGQGICSVMGCENEAEYYIDFPKMEEPKEGVWSVDADLIRTTEKQINYKIRRLTPKECERLNGFQDDWTQKGKSGKIISDTARYNALGNSIAVPCAERIFVGILKNEWEG